MAIRACQTNSVGVGIFSSENIRNCEAYVLKMQRRLDKAVASNNKKKIRWYVHLLSKRSRAVKTLAVYHITSENDGKYTAGVDKVCIKRDSSKETKDKQRLKLLKAINIKKKPLPIRRVFIPKSKTKKRPLGIPTMLDRIHQDIIRMSIEPIAEYHFNDNSYGFRPKKSCHDAIEHLFIKLAKRSNPQWIIEGDIKGCFDNISHEHITKTILKWDIPKSIVNIVEEMLKAKIFYSNRLIEVETGTAQGGVLSPMLMNIALTELDNFCAKFAKWCNPIVRYADDFVLVCKTQEEAENIRDEVAKFLKEKIGLTLSLEKTAITHISKGFDFLGFNIRKYRNGKSSTPKLLIKPQKEKVVEFLRNIAETLKDNKAAKTETIIQLLNPILRGLAMYYRFVASNKTFRTIDHKLWEMLWRWAKRRHPHQTKRRVSQKYFTRVKGDNNVFTDGKGLHILRIGNIPIIRFIKIKSGIRVYSSDKQTREYWSKRTTVNALNQVFSIKIERLLKCQKGKCACCGKPIESIADTHIHHMKTRSEGGTDELNNLRLLHQSCHKEVHIILNRKQMSWLMDMKLNYVKRFYIQNYCNNPDKLLKRRRVAQITSHYVA